ncbi:MAG: hypothetical protein RTU30_07030 [Candidatus Thorarchaeota archaeon]
MSDQTFILSFTLRLDSGYPHPEFNEKHREEIPDYRWLLLWTNIIPRSPPGIMRLFEIYTRSYSPRTSFPVTTPCRSLERAKQRINLTAIMMFSPEQAEELSKSHRLLKDVKIHLEASIESEEIESVLAGVRSKTHQFLISQRNALLLESTLYRLVQDTMNLIGSRLSLIDPDMMSGISGMVQTLQQTSSPVEWNNVSNTCRVLLQRFTDAVYLEEMTPEGKSHPTHEKTKNKCRYIAAWALSRIGTKRDKMPEVRRIEEIPEFLDNYYEYLIRGIEKVKHKDTFLLERDEVERIVIYVVLWMADLIRLLDRAKYNWSKREN